MGENGEIMKKNFFFVLVIMFLFAVMLSACGQAESKTYSFNNITFVVEPNPDYLGSYTLQRCNTLHPTICWEEWGEWSSSIELALDSNKRIFVGENKGVFRARSDYHWVANGNRLVLEKRK